MSLKAIAKELGISVTTVSRALNGYDDVSQETRARVEAEAQRRGYRPNTFARRLKMGKIDAVGLVFPVRPAPLNNNVFLEMVGEISHELARYEIDLLLIADDEQADKHGYMRMVHTPLLAAFPNRVVNLHPALLPSFTGAHAIDDAFARGVKVTGVTVHFANEIYDNGPIIAQRALAVEEGWDVDTLEEHIHAIEHVLYPEVVQMLADGRVHVLGSGKVAIDPAR